MNRNHHAIVYLVDDVTQTPFDLAQLQKSSEVREVQAQTLSIDEVRSLIAAAYVRPFQEQLQTIIVRTNTIGIEAQHALLKVIEEPPLSTHFIFVIQRGSVILPTVLSRVHLVTVDEPTTITPLHETGEFLVFLRADTAKRLERIAAIVKEKEGTTATVFENALASYLLHGKIVAVETKKRLAWCHSQLRLRGASKKMLWEEIALTLPKGGG